jgi:hypothetical protein
MILVGEVKDFAGAQWPSADRKASAGFSAMLEDGLYRRLQARFENELALWERMRLLT